MRDMGRGIGPARNRSRQTRLSSRIKRQLPSTFSSDTKKPNDIAVIRHTYSSFRILCFQGNIEEAACLNEGISHQRCVVSPTQAIQQGLGGKSQEADVPLKVVERHVDYREIGKDK